MDIFTLDNFTAFLTLTALEVVLGIDNIVFIAIVAGRLPENQRDRARQIGLTLAIVTRLLLLCSLSWLMGLTGGLIEVAGKSLSGKDLILLLGGLFLIAKSTKEIHHKFEAVEAKSENLKPEVASFSSIIAQILLIDIIFSLDSVITAVGMVKSLVVMGAAVVVAVIIMLVFSKAIVAFIERHPTVKMLALAFLILIGVLLVAEGFHQEFDRGYVYFAMAFALLVEMLNINLRRQSS